MPRSIEKIDLTVTMTKFHHRRRDRDAPLLLDFHPIAGGVTRGLTGFNRTSHLNRTAEQKQLFGKSRFPSIRMADDAKRPALIYFVHKFVIQFDLICLFYFSAGRFQHPVEWDNRSV